MFRVLTRTVRHRAARLLAVAYLACVIGPPLAFAFADAAVAAHCLTGDRHAATAAVHVHSDGATHQHDHPGSGHEQADADGTNPPGQCCGLFCLNALADTGGVGIAAAPMCSRALQAGLRESLGGIGSFRIERPPNVLASL
jgi:hypothetical protein